MSAAAEPVNPYRAEHVRAAWEEGRQHYRMSPTAPLRGVIDATRGRGEHLAFRRGWDAERDHVAGTPLDAQHRYRAEADARRQRATAEEEEAARVAGLLVTARDAVERARAAGESPRPTDLAAALAAVVEYLEETTDR